MTSPASSPADDGGATETNVVDKSGAEPLTRLDPQRAISEAQARAAQQIVRLRSRYAAWLLRALLFQVVAADVVFVWYGASAGWRNVPAAAISAWLGAVVVQVVVLVTAIVRFLFSREALVFLAPEEPSGPSDQEKGRLRAAWDAFLRR